MTERMIAGMYLIFISQIYEKLHNNRIFFCVTTYFTIFATTQKTKGGTHDVKL